MKITSKLLRFYENMQDQIQKNAEEIAKEYEKLFPFREGVSKIKVENITEFGVTIVFWYGGCGRG